MGVVHQPSDVTESDTIRLKSLKKNGNFSLASKYDHNDVNMSID